MRVHRSIHSAGGQAAVELVVVLPLALAALAALGQAGLYGHAALMARQAADGAARAHAVGADARRAARAALPAHLERRLIVSPRADGAVAVRVRVPSLLPGVRIGRVGAAAHHEAQS